MERHQRKHVCCVYVWCVCFACRCDVVLHISSACMCVCVCCVVFRTRERDIRGHCGWWGRWREWSLPVWTTGLRSYYSLFLRAEPNERRCRHGRASRRIQPGVCVCVFAPPPAPRPFVVSFKLPHVTGFHSLGAYTWAQSDVCDDPTHLSDRPSSK
jgi:hypothetical protein